MQKPPSPSRLVIESVYPEIDGGRYPVKRCIGDWLDVWADIFMDGHDRLLAAVDYAPMGEQDWREAPMAHSDNDRWHGRIPLDRIGRWHYTIKAWPDAYGSWQRDTRKKREAGQDIALELAEGRQLIDTLLQPVKTRQRMLELLGHAEGEALADILLSAQVATLMAELSPRRGECSYRTLEVIVDRKRAEFSAWYELFPRSQGTQAGKSGTFTDCEVRLPDIKQMGFDIVYFPPIHPIGKTFRKGKNNTLTPGPDDVGSPYAIGSQEGGHKDIHPDLGTLADFRRFVKAASDLGLEVALDFAIQCSPDHPYIKTHPEWFRFRPDGSIRHAENPPKQYQDIVNVNFGSPSAGALWEELRSIVQFWIRQGVTIFRVDNPHTKPFAFWEWLIGSIQAERPDIIFLAEAFTRPKIMYLLAKAGFTQSYSYFTWRNTKQELTEYLTELATGWTKDYFRPNFFPTTPDILPWYLQTGGRPGFLIRLTLAATLSGNYGVYSGYELCESAALPGKEEYADSERFEQRPRDWNAPGNIKGFITAINRIRHENPALQQFKNLRFYPASNEQILFYGKWSEDRRNIVFIVVNLDPHQAQEAFIDMPLAEFGLSHNTLYRLDDLLQGHSWEWEGARQFQHLDPQKNPVAIFGIRDWGLRIGGNQP